MAEPVVDVLEAVQVEEEHRHEPGVAGDPRQREFEPVEKERAVRQAGQLVVQRAMAEDGRLAAQRIE